MEHYAGIDVSLERSSVCVIGAAKRIVHEAKVPSEPEALVRLLGQLGVPVTRIGLEAGPRSQAIRAVPIEWRAPVHRAAALGRLPLVPAPMARAVR